MDLYKKTNINISIMCFVLAGLVWLYWTFHCAQTCSYLATEYFLRPLLWGSLGAGIITLTLLPFPSILFRAWLRHIGWWGALVTLVGIASTDPQSSHILSLGRGQVAWILCTLFFALTCIYVVVWHLWFRYSRKQQTVRLMTLLYLVPFVALFAAISQYLW